MTDTRLETFYISWADSGMMQTRCRTHLADAHPTLIRNAVQVGPDLTVVCEVCGAHN